MRVLIDTCAFLWLASDAEELSNTAKHFFFEDKNDFFLSIASIWELAIKLSLKKLELLEPLDKLITNQIQTNGITLLEIDFRHVVRIATLPFHHRDPFDRLLVSQAIEEKMAILSSDMLLDNYSIQRIW
jgi:PIN domain nuclease of toxin-antitoxin system